MRKTASSRDLFAKLEDELKKKPVRSGKSAKTAKPASSGRSAEESIPPDMG
jgi:hypothetical protein